MSARQIALGTPQRIQRRRLKGWRAPAGAVYVGRGSKWGNPCTQIRMPALDGSEWEREGRLGKTSGEWHGFRHPDGSTTSHLVQDATREQAVAMFRDWLVLCPSLAEAARAELAGRDLMCWCPPDEPCHADVLLELAHGTTAVSPDFAASVATGLVETPDGWAARVLTDTTESEATA